MDTLMKRFHDIKSSAQIAVFKLYEIHAAKWRNAKNLARWNDSCRSRWEVEQLRPLSGFEREMRAAALRDLIG